GGAAAGALTPGGEVVGWWKQKAPGPRSGGLVVHNPTTSQSHHLDTSVRAADLDPVEQPAAAETRPNRLLGQLLEVVIGHLPGDHYLRLGRRDHQSAELGQRTGGQNLGGLGRRQNG